MSLYCLALYVASSIGMLMTKADRGCSDTILLGAFMRHITGLVKLCAPRTLMHGRVQKRNIAPTWMDLHGGFLLGSGSPLQVLPRSQSWPAVLAPGAPPWPASPSAAAPAATSSAGCAAAWPCRPPRPVPPRRVALIIATYGHLCHACM